MNSGAGEGYRKDAVALSWRPGAGALRGAGRAAQCELPGGGIAAWLQREVAASWAACGAFEWIALGYLAASSALIVLFAENLAHPVRLVGVQIVLAAMILALCRVEARAAYYARRNKEIFSARWWHFWRHWYPHVFFLFCFEELGKLVHLVNPRWEDAKLIAFDYWLTGVHPAVWLEQFATPARNDFMQFAYLTYFVYLLVLGGILYYRRDWQEYWSVMTYSAAGYAIGYVIAILFPIESPWFAMAGAWHGELRGGAATAVIHFIEHFGRVRGAAFPSEHVAGSFAALWGAWRHRRWLFWVMLPLVLCMCVSTVWGRYHYVVDVFAGMITGTLGYVIGAWVMKKGGAVAASAESHRAKKTSLQRRATVWRVHAFEGKSDLQESEFGGVEADELQTHGQT
ncbi:MAG: phosphatase PAP2 family protein [Candidatus Acidiferrales bacterium]